MFLQKLSLTNFKNCSEAILEFSDKINCFVGDNGAGKTNILDAIYYLSFCKSYFNPIDTLNIKHNCDFFSIHGSYQNLKNSDDKISCIQKRNHKKVFRLNKTNYNRLADHIGTIPLVMISPYDRDLINDGSEVRRKYIDGVISQFDRNYLNDLINYNKALLQRNTLLKQMFDGRYFDEAAIEIWNDKLVLHGQTIFDKREQFLSEFNPLFEEYYNFLAGTTEKVNIVYESQFHENNFKELLKISAEKDRITRYTNTGIHKDDLIFTINSFPVKKFGSQGQQKSFVIAIKLAQFEFTRRIKSFKPILLFDDIFDKLDDKRVRQIIQLVSENNFGQVFITDTQKQRIEKIFNLVSIDHRIFNVADGEVVPET
ncbi:MAG: DNA replication and repair protein RecF [Bacteroidetes bacterium]|nr:DNA replication and repair protein RecF [Bacteroidota bacterium]